MALHSWECAIHCSFIGITLLNIQHKLTAHHDEGYFLLQFFLDIMDYCALKN